MTRKQLGDIIADVHHDSIDIKNRIIYLHDHITDEGNAEIDYRVANRFIKNMNILETTNTDPITVYLSSDGGYVDYGMSIYDVIKNSSLKIAIVGHGSVSSIASIIFQAADLRILYPSTCFLIHDICSDLKGKRLEVLNHASRLKKEFDLMIDIYVEKMVQGSFFKGKTFAQIRNYLLKKLKNTPELYLTADEAVNWGLADGIFGSNDYNSLSSIKNGV